MLLRPIIFSKPMVLAIMDDRKSVTRRTRGLDKINHSPDLYYFQFQEHNKAYFSTPSGDTITIKCPYGQPGDFLWVRETFQIVPPNMVFFKADPENNADHHWKPSIHMPKQAARIILQVEDIRLERLHDITEGGAFAEGVELITNNSAENTKVFMSSASYISSFKILWNKIKGAGSWEANPWVWVIAFKPISKTGWPVYLKNQV